MTTQIILQKAGAYCNNSKEHLSCWIFIKPSDELLESLAPRINFQSQKIRRRHNKEKPKGDNSSECLVTKARMLACLKVVIVHSAQMSMLCPLGVNNNLDAKSEPV